MPDHGGRDDAEAHPESSQRILDGEQGGLSIIGVLERFRGSRLVSRLGEEQLPQVPIQVGLKDVTTGIDPLPENGFGAV